MTQSNIIIPRKLSGFMELPPHKQMIFDDMMDKIKEVFKKNAFLPLDTPVLELSEILLAKSGGDIDKEIYRFNKGDTDICMRYDLTVPLARFVAMEKANLSFPFKRFQIGKVYRGEKAQKGRFREFYQCDADIIGMEQLPIPADGECINMISEIFKAIKVDNILIQISNRNILFGLCQALDLQEKTEDILILLDKMPKIGKEKVFASLLDLQISEDKANMLINVAGTKGTFEDVLAKVKDLCDNQTYTKGIQDLERLGKYLQACGLEKDRYILDLGIIRGHNYYTGTVFETIMTTHPEFGVICAGGRYDNLTQYFSDKKMPGVGLSVGLTRLFDLLDKNNLLPQYPLSPVKVEIIPLGDTLEYCLQVERFLKNNGIICETNWDERSFKGKMKDANKRQIPYVCVIGESEVESGKLALKDMISGTQQSLSKEEIVKLVK